MARDGATPLARFAGALARDDGLTFGAPWLSDDGTEAFLPILRTEPHPSRCALAAEASDAVSAVDPGRLDRLTVRNDSPRPLFLLPGTVFRSGQTACRATTVGFVLPPRTAVSVEVKCVERSRPLVRGASLAPDPRLAPARVCRALLSRDQGRVWAVVGERSSPSDEGPAGLFAPVAEDGAAVASKPSIGPSLPILARQCGIVILGAGGVSAIEWFESPESWKVIAHSVLNRYAEPAHRGGQSAWKTSLDVPTAIHAAREFVSRLVGRALRQMGPSSWAAEDGTLAYTALDGRLVHLLVLSPEDGAGHDQDLPLGDFSTGVTASPDDIAPTASVLAEPVDADVVAAAIAESLPDDASVPPPGRPRRRKVLTSGWDSVTFETLDRYAAKEFRGDRSAAMRFLVRQGLRVRGYFGPLPAAARGSEPTSLPGPSPAAELDRAGLESRVADLERVAETPEYAVWLRKRARLELERMASAMEDDGLRAAARAAVDRLAPVEPEPLPAPEAWEEVLPETPPPPGVVPPPDVRALLREAFAASAGGDYKDAIALFDHILGAETGNRTARLGRAVALRRAGKSQEALDDLEVVLRLEPRNAAALLARGQILQARGDLDGALACFDLLVAVAASDWDVWMARGDVLAKIGRNDEALRSYGEALRRNPDDPNLQARIRALERARAPAPPTTLPRPPMPPGVEPGQSYLIQEARHERSYSLFRTLASQRAPSLVLTGRSRDLVRREVGVSAARIIGLSFSPGEDLHNPTQLASLIRTIERFVYDNQGAGVILVDGLHDLVANNGFRDTALAIERIHDTILQSQAILIVSMGPEDLAEREAALLERSLRLLS